MITVREGRLQRRLRARAFGADQVILPMRYKEKVFNSKRIGQKQTLASADILHVHLHARPSSRSARSFLRPACKHNQEKVFVWFLNIFFRLLFRLGLS